MAKRAKELDRKLGACLDTERIIRGMTQQQLAEKVGVTYQQIHKYFKGINRISVGRFIDICLALEVTPASVLRQIVREQPAADVGRSVLEMSRTFMALTPHHRQVISNMARALVDETKGTASDQYKG